MTIFQNSVIWNVFMFQIKLIMFLETKDIVNFLECWKSFIITTLAFNRILHQTNLWQFSVLMLFWTIHSWIKYFLFLMMFSHLLVSQFALQHVKFCRFFLKREFILCICWHLVKLVNLFPVLFVFHIHDFLLRILHFFSVSHY